MKILMKSLLFGGFCLLTGGVQAKTISTPKAAVILNEGQINQRVCYFDDKAYTIGAVIVVGEVLLECVAEKDFELNGALKWQKLEGKNEQ